jgi:hypothetical protein
VTQRYMDNNTKTALPSHEMYSKRGRERERDERGVQLIPPCITSKGPEETAEWVVDIDETRIT